MTGQPSPLPWACPGCQVVYKIPAGKRPPPLCPACRRDEAPQPAAASPPELLTEFAPPPPQPTLAHRFKDAVTLGPLRRWLLAELKAFFRLAYLLACVSAAVAAALLLAVAIRVTIFGPPPQSEPSFSPGGGSGSVSYATSGTAPSQSNRATASRPPEPVAAPEPKRSLWDRFGGAEKPPEKTVTVKGYTTKDGRKVESYVRKKPTRD